MKDDPGKLKMDGHALADEEMYSVSGGAGKTDAWVRQLCPNCGKIRTMNMDAYGNYVCIVCHKKFTLKKNKE